MLLRAGAHHLDLSSPVIMGILNTTPDSFSDGGNCYTGDHLDLDLALARGQQILREGAKIIDVGGESTRPGALPVTRQQELDRVIPVVERLVRETDGLISVDTSDPQVITEAAQAGASLINDVRALQREGALAAAAATGLPVCLMHMQGHPETMQDRPAYTDPVAEVRDFLQARAGAAEAAGIVRDQLLLDPGFGFGKSLAHNLLLLQQLPQLADLGYPLLVGLSRKSMLGALLGRELSERLPGSLGLALLAADRGAAIIRVHDVQATADVLALRQAVLSAG